MNITTEEIKWMCKYADGFKHSCGIDDDTGEAYEYINGETLGRELVKKYILPLLLQRAIDGVNKECDDWYIEQFLRGIAVNTDEDDETKRVFSFKGNKGIDNAKLSALRYVMEQEVKG